MLFNYKLSSSLGATNELSTEAIVKKLSEYSNSLKDPSELNDLYKSLEDKRDTEGSIINTLIDKLKVKVDLKAYTDTDKLSYLRDVCKEGSRYDMHKLFTDRVAELYRHTLKDISGKNGFITPGKAKTYISFNDYALRVSACANLLSFSSNDKDKLKLKEAWYCRVPNCPNCQWSRTKEWRSRFFKLLPVIQKEYPKHRWLFLTLTTANCELGKLNKTIKHLNESFNRLARLSSYPFIGAIKSVEVTRSYDCYDESNNFIATTGTKQIKQWIAQGKKLTIKPSNKVHPHIHLIGLVAPEYFDSDCDRYITHEQWVAMWRKSLKVTYYPLVGINAVKEIDFNKKSDFDNAKQELEIANSDPSIELSDIENEKNLDLIRAILEVLKYTCKEQDLIGEYCDDLDINSEWLKKFTEQTYRLNRIQPKGMFRELCREIEESFKNESNLKVGNKAGTPENYLRAEWDEKAKKHIML